MRAYLKNGRTVKITQKIANDIVNMKIEQGKNPGSENTLVSRNIISNNVFAYLDIDEIIAIR